MFFYRHVLGRELGNVDGVVRAGAINRSEGAFSVSPDCRGFVTGVGAAPHIFTVLSDPGWSCIYPSPARPPFRSGPVAPLEADIMPGLLYCANSKVAVGK